jgi:hypothetical protein
MVTSMKWIGHRESTTVMKLCVIKHVIKRANCYDESAGDPTLTGRVMETPLLMT